MTEKPRIEDRLSALREAIAWPTPSADLAPRVTARIEASPTANRVRVPRLAVATALVLVFVATMMLSPATREAIADLFSTAGVRIGVTDDPVPVTGADLNLGDRITLEEAAGQVDFPLRVPVGDRPGPPDGVYLSRDGQVSMVWAGSPALPAAGDTGVALLLTQSRAVAGTDFATKTISPDAEVADLQVEGVPALWIEGAPHTFTILDDEGNPAVHTTRLAANVLLWEVGGVNHRLETTGGLSSALAVVEVLEPVP